MSASKEELRHAWRGVEGERMFDRLRGVWQPETETPRTSVGHSHVLPPDLRRRDAAFAVLHRLTQKAAMRLRSYHCVAGRHAIPMKVGVTFTELTDASARTAALFESHEQQDTLNAVIDSLNLRFGKNTFYFGGAHLARDQAPLRIAFTHIPDRTLEE